MSVNKVTLVGHLGQDPELKYSKDSLAICTFSMCTNEEWKTDLGEKKKRTEWHRIVVYGKLAEFINKAASKGSKLYLEGRIQTRTWEDKQKIKRYTTEIVANKTEIMQKQKDFPDNAMLVNADTGEIITEDYASDDIPF